MRLSQCTPSWQRSASRPAARGRPPTGGGGRRHGHWCHPSRVKRETRSTVASQSSLAAAARRATRPLDPAVKHRPRCVDRPEVDRARMRMMRPYRWLTVSTRDREAPQLVRERVKCGKPSCRCARGVKHGPYWYFRYEEWDRAAGVVRYRREYVPKSELARVRRWIRRDRIAHGRVRSFLRFARRYVSRPKQCVPQIVAR